MLSCLIIVLLHVFCCQIVAMKSPSLLNSLCSSEGRFPHPEDCGAFIDCLPDGDGVFVPRIGSCKGLAYDGNIGKCVSWRESTSCQLSANDVNGDARGFSLTSASPVRSAMHDRLCETGLGFICASCMEIITCIDGVAYIDSCPDAMRCEIKTSFRGGVCYPNRAPDMCFCNATGQVISDVYDPRTFFFCRAPGRRPDTFYCPEDYIFDDDSESCSKKPAVPPCSKSGVFAVPGRCRWFYTCTQLSTKKTFMQHFATCTQKDMVYSTTKKTCTDPYALPASDPCTRTSERKVRYICSLWGFILSQLFPQRIGNFCYS